MARQSSSSGVPKHYQAGSIYASAALFGFGAVFQAELEVAESGAGSYDCYGKGGSMPLLCTLVASASKTIDQWFVILVWSAVGIGSVILIVKNARRPPDRRGFYFGQLAVLPRSWQRWILGEREPSKGDDRPSPG
jgi:hypothetical protein